MGGKPHTTYVFQRTHPGFASMSSRTSRAGKKREVARVVGVKDDACIVVIYLRSDGAIVCSLERAWLEEMRLAASGGALDDFAVLDVVGVVGLDVDGEAVEGALEGVLGRGVHHAGLCG